MRPGPADGQGPQQGGGAERAEDQRQPGRVVAADDLPVDEPDGHVHQDDERQQGAGRAAGEPLRLDQERHAPQQEEDHRGELGGEVHPHAEPGAGFVPGRGDLLPHEALAGAGAGGGSAAFGVVLEEGQHQHEDDQAGGGAARERPRPAGVVQQPGQHDGRDEVARHPEQGRDLRDHRAVAGGEPAGAQAQHADERHRVTAAQQGAAGQGRAVGVGEGEAELAGGEQDGAQGEHLLGAEPVDQQADGYLHARVDEQLEYGEGRQGRGADVEALGGVDAGDAEAGAEDDGDEVHGDAGPPDADRPASAGWVAGQCRGALAHRVSPRARLRTQLTCRSTTSVAAAASPERRASRISVCSAMFLAMRSGWACITATPMRS